MSLLKRLKACRRIMTCLDENYMARALRLAEKGVIPQRLTQT